MSQMTKYEGKQGKLGFVKASELLPVGTQSVIRTLEGDIKLLIDEESYILIDNNCGIEVIGEDYFFDNYKQLSGECSIKPEYTPKIKVKNTNEYIDLIQYMKLCTNKKIIQVLAKELNRGIKIFTPKTGENYMLGNPGDFLVVSCDDANDIRVVEQKMFKKLYQQIET